MEEHITGRGYNPLVIFKIWRGSMLNIPLNWRSNFSSKLIHDPKKPHINPQVVCVMYAYINLEIMCVYYK